MQVFITSIELVNVTRFDKKIALFGRAKDGKSVAVIAEGFFPHILINSDSSKVDIADLNDKLRPYKSCPDEIVRWEEVSLQKAVGYSANAKSQMLKLYYTNPGRRHALLKALEESNVKVYHGDWDVPHLFLLQHKLQLQANIVFSDAVPRPNRTTTCDREFSASCFVLSKDDSMVPMKCCTVRHRVFSHASTRSNPVLPRVADNASDYVSAICCRVYMMNDSDTTTASLDAGGPDEKKTISTFEAFLRANDPDCIVFLSDKGNPLLDINTRSPKTDLGRVLGHTSAYMGILTVPGRTVYCLTADMEKRQMSPKLDSFSFADIAFHPQVIRTPPPHDLRGFASITAKFLPHEEMMAQCATEADILKQIESGNLIKYVKVSRLTNTPITKSISGGQQERVMRLVTQKYYNDNWYINDEDLLFAPLVVKRNRTNSSFPDPIFDRPKIGKGTSLRNIFGAPIEGKKITATKKAFTGGMVLDPAPGFHTEHPVFTFDFGSLYPSIMEGYGLDPAVFIVDPAHENNPAVKKSYIPINEDECVVIATMNPDGTLPRTVVPETIKKLVQQRVAVKSQMKNVSHLDAFQLSALDSEQLCCKITCNAFYGFYGVKDGMRAKFRYKMMSASTCAIGRYMSMIAAAHIVKNGGKIVYGGPCFFVVNCFLSLIVFCR
jgi:DNA polymerase elongation subunit (family B)